MPYLQSSSIASLQRIRIASQPRWHPGIQPGIEQDGCDMLGKGHYHMTGASELTPGEVRGHQHFAEALLKPGPVLSLR